MNFFFYFISLSEEMESFFKHFLSDAFMAPFHLTRPFDVIKKMHGVMESSSIMSLNLNKP